jgi:hypothetical protein
MMLMMMILSLENLENSHGMNEEHSWILLNTHFLNVIFIKNSLNWIILLFFRFFLKKIYFILNFNFELINYKL